MRRLHFATLLLLLSSSLLPAAPTLSVDEASLVKFANFEFDRPVSRSEAGLPVGNGRMGTLIWTTPKSLRMQINRVDVFGNDSTTNSFPVRYSDYCGGLGFIDVELGGYGQDLFTSGAMTQSLDMNTGVASFNTESVTARVIASMHHDVMAVEIEDHRPNPRPIRVNLRMLRPAQLRNRSQVATSRLSETDGAAILTQAFEEDSFYNGSALAVSVSGRESEPWRTHDEEMSLVMRPGPGKFTILISSTATMNRDERDQLAAQAASLLKTPAAQDFQRLLAANTEWWSEFWSRGHVNLRSPDGVAEEVEKNYYTYLYLMASSSRGKYPTKFNGMIWTTGGDRRQWGINYWGANQSCLYNALFPTNRLELMDPMFNMYYEMRESLALASRQQWGSEGIFIPETHAYNGLAPLPDDIAAEMRELYLLRKPWSEASQKFKDYASTKQPHSSRWNWIGGGRWEAGRWIPEERDNAPFGPVTHILSRGAKIAYQYWMRYEYTLDKDWLREQGYPMIKGVAEFYRNFPNLRKTEDGKYHIFAVNSNESVTGAMDTDEEISSIMGLFPAAIKASEILGVDEDLRAKWKEVLDNLAPLPTTDNPVYIAARARQAEEDAKNPPAETSNKGGKGGKGRRGGGQDTASDGRPTWMRGLPTAMSRGGGRPDGNTMPMWMFDLCTLENTDARTMEVANNTFDGYVRRNSDGPARIGVLSKVGVTAAMMGRADDVKRFIPGQLFYPDRAPVMDNRMDQREGAQTTSVQRLGRVADTLHCALVQSVGAGPAQDPIIRVFPAWPKDWDANFRLLCKGGFMVSSLMEGGNITFVELESQLGGQARVRNPWNDQKVTVYSNGQKSEDLVGSLLTIETNKGEILTLVPAGTTPDQVKKVVSR